MSFRKAKMEALASLTNAELADWLDDVANDIQKAIDLGEQENWLYAIVERLRGVT